MSYDRTIDPQNEKIGHRIRERRKAAELTQKKLGAIIGKTESSVAKYEKGEIEIPLGVLKSISIALDADINYLLNGKTLEQHNKEYLENVKERVRQAEAGQDYLQDLTDDQRFAIEVLVMELREKNKGS